MLLTGNIGALMKIALTIGFIFAIVASIGLNKLLLLRVKDKYKRYFFLVLFFLPLVFLGGKLFFSFFN